MIYTDKRYASKAALKRAIAAGETPTVYAPTPWGNKRGADADGERLPICGPGPYERRWYGQVDVQDGVIVRVRS